MERTRSKLGRFCPWHSVVNYTQPTVVDFMKRFPDVFQTVTDRDLFGMNTLTRWLTNSGCVAQALLGTGKLVANGQTIVKAMFQQLHSDLCVAAAMDQPEHRPLLPKLDILAVDPDKELQEEWEAEDDVKGGPLDPREVKNARGKEIKCWWDTEVCEYCANRMLETLRVVLSVACQEDVFQAEDLFLISIADVSRAHFNADAVRDVYVRLPDEDPKAKQPGVCGKLR